MSTFADEGFELLPADDDDIPADLALDAAATSAIAVDDPAAPLDEEQPEPFGMSWEFDYERGRFKRAGAAPAEVRGLDALKQRCLMALHTARFAHPVFTDAFGMEDPEDLIGEVHVEDRIGDYERRVREALLALDERISDVTDFSASYDPTVGVLTIDKFSVITDEDEQLSLAGVIISG